MTEYRRPQTPQGRNLLTGKARIYFKEALKRNPDLSVERYAWLNRLPLDTVMNTWNDIRLRDSRRGRTKEDPPRFFDTLGFEEAKRILGDRLEEFKKARAWKLDGEFCTIQQVIEAAKQSGWEKQK